MLIITILIGAQNTVKQNPQFYVLLIFPQHRNATIPIAYRHDAVTMWLQK
ncbi:MAG: hypothetical protein WCS58_02015 [Candidatus Cloacimonadaceae bacterium]